MNAQRVGELFEKMSRSPEVLKEFVAFAARHGIDVSDDQLSDTELANVSGGTNSAMPTQLQLTQGSFEAASTAEKTAYDLQKAIRSSWPTG